MGPAEWLGVLTLVVAAFAFGVASLTLINQMAALKRPLTSVDFHSLERVAKVPPPGGAIMIDTVVWGLLIKVTNRGHEPMLNPRVYDSTPGYVIFEESNRAYSMPYEMKRGETVEMVTSYSLANDYDRVISVVWEEPALFRRTAVTIGVRFEVSAKKDIAFDVEPTAYWERIGPFGKKGWKRPGGFWSNWRPVRGTSTDPGNGNIWSNTYEHPDADIFRTKRFLVSNFSGEDMVGDKVVSSETLAQLRQRGEQVPKENPQRKG